MAIRREQLLETHQELKRFSRATQLLRSNTMAALDNYTLRESEELYRFLTENTNDLITLYDVEGHRVYVSPSFARLLGWVPAATFGGVHPEDLQATRQAWQQVLAGEKTFVTFRHAHADGSWRWLEAWGSLVHYQGKPHVMAVTRDITERKQVEEALQQAHQNYVTLVNSIDGIVWEADARTFTFNFVSHQAERLLGYPVERWLTEPTFWKDHIHPDDQEWAVNFCVQSTHQKRPHDFEYRMLAADGRVVWLRDIVTVVVENDQAVRLRGVMVDITEQKRAEEAAKESQEQLRLAFEATKIGTGELDLQLNQTTFSNALQQVLGFAPGAFNPTFEGYVERVHPEDRALVRQAVEQAIAGQPDIALDYRIVWPDGSIRWVTSRATTFYDGAGKATRIIGALMDITERKQVEEELRQHREHLEELVAERTAELAIAKERAEEADRLKSAFLATMSHELRTPLNSIIGFTGIMVQGLAGPLNDEQQKQLNMVKNSARHLLNLINEVLDLSKIEAGQVELQMEPFDMSALIDKTVQTLAPLAQKKKLKLSAEVAPEVAAVISDQRRVEQILINLVNNAIKFTEKGQVHIECWAHDRRLLTSVVDTGIGIKPEDMAKLFTTFRQLDSTLGRKHEGTGLGLAICQKLADLLGGEIRVESVWGVGSNFTLTLPLKIVD
jgi:PAS domain S-box-containing protein